MSSVTIQFQCYNKLKRAGYDIIRSRQKEDSIYFITKNNEKVIEIVENSGVVWVLTKKYWFGAPKVKLIIEDGEPAIVACNLVHI